MEKSFQSRLETVVLRESGLQAWPSAGLREPGCWEGSRPSLTDKCLNCLHGEVSVEPSLWGLNLGTCQAEVPV